MLFVECPYCHKLVFRLWYGRHRARHTERRPDGQMADHITVHPEGRYRGSLKDVPQWYRHEECDEVTGMPDDIIRSYLVNPFLYSDKTFCCGCNDYVSHEECFWEETGQCLADYFEDLKDDYVSEHGEPPPATRA